jgi:catechol 2,3-dioxygenase-like lactoylglutathione lyase family enzyme
MKRMHVHLGVKDIAESVGFYSALFGASPTVLQSDYAKWMLDDPRVNFAISTRGPAGLDHLGMQVDDAAELQAAADKLTTAGTAVVHQDDALCCYARSDKAWVSDPQGIAWETFFSHGTATVYGEDKRDGAPAAAGGCCAPRPDTATAAPSSCGPRPASSDKPAAACCG